MNARQLLDPKGFAKEQAKKKKAEKGPVKHATNQEIMPSATSFFPTTQETLDPRNLNNPRTFPATSSSNGGYLFDSTDNYSSGQTLNDNSQDERGMGSLIENLHNVSSRVVEQPSKRKVDTADESSGARKKYNMFNASSMGELTQEEPQVQEEKDNAVVNRANETIDLTNEPDDDVEFLTETRKENPNDEICLGVLHMKANMSKLPNVSARSLNPLVRGSFPLTKLNAVRKPGTNRVIALLDRQGKTCGRIEDQAASKICPLLDRANAVKLRIVVYLQAHNRAGKETRPGAAISELLRIDCIIYAARGHSMTLGETLARKGLLLSAPPPIVGKEYSNPQEPSFSRPATSRVWTKEVQRTQEEIRNDTNNMFDNLVNHDELEEMEADSTYIAVELLSHQKQGLRFLTDHENLEEDVPLWKYRATVSGKDSWYNIITGHEVKEKPQPPCGGILADMMGLGKTLIIIALIASTRQDAAYFAHHGTPPEEPIERNFKSTLVICPKSVLSNWTKQIREFTKPGKFRVYTYHGTSRTQDLHELAKYDVVLTTYNTVVSDYTRKKALSYVKWFRIVLDEAHTIRNASSLFSKSCNALEAQRRWAVTGTPVQNNLDDLGSLIKFLRVEPFDYGNTWAQHIVAAFKRGSPEALPNLRLLVASVTLRRLKDKIDLPSRTEHKINLEFSRDEGRVYSHIAHKLGISFRILDAAAKGVMRGKLYANALIWMSHLRMLCAHGLEMFSEEDQIGITEGLYPDTAIAIDLGDEPELDSTVFMTDKQAYDTFKLLVDDGDDLCTTCHRSLSGKQNNTTDVTDDDELEDDGDSSTEDNTDTPIQKDELGAFTACYQLLCPECLDSHVLEEVPKLSSDGRHMCPFCGEYERLAAFDLSRQKFKEHMKTQVEVTKSGKAKRWGDDFDFEPHTKVQALIADLNRYAAESALLPPGEPPIRSVVFSGWVKYLDLISISLDKANIKYVRLDGKMSLKARAAVLSTFESDPDIRVFLISITAGGQGLNLVAANKVYMMEPQLNPGVEQQAVDRVHRLGQKRPVEVIRYFMARSMDLHVLGIQQRKIELADLSLERQRTREEVAKERSEHWKKIFTEKPSVKAFDDCKAPPASSN